ncbi:MAG: leucyl/phenylalanyl-tRNA--protein transferase [Candidatus Dadabacteria bacterium]|nr:leucyl/phenylalanyl-tRNA--protein transferase [Candidatus Dadabacteria bacterium]
MTVHLLDDTLVFPHPMCAEPNGLLAVGGDLSVDRLLLAYRNGIFPWYSESDPIMWFSPNPRLVLFLDDLYVSSKLKKIIRSNIFEVRFDTSFHDVLTRCAQNDRRGQDGTWITDDMVKAYVNLHEEGYAHSVETFHGGKLVGGLYGVSLGGAFFGESMFFEMNNASKVALYHLVEKLRSWDFDFIDSQVPNDHMKGLGGRELEREEFLRMLESSLGKKTILGNWGL